MLERHAVQELLRAGVSPRAIAKQYGVSRRTIERIRREAPVTTTAVADAVEAASRDRAATRRGDPPRAGGGVVAQRAGSSHGRGLAPFT